MPLPRFDNLDPDRQEAILEVAADAFAAKGPDGASMNAIIAQAGISKGSFYYYFADKADLFGEVVRRELGALFSDLDPVEGADSAVEFWRVIETQVLQTVERVQVRPRAAALLRGLYGSTEGTAALGELLEGFSTWLDCTLQAGQRVGAVRDDVPRDLLAELALGAGTAADRWFAERMETLEGEAMVRLTIACTQMMRRMLAPPDATAPSAPSTAQSDQES